MKAIGMPPSDPRVRQMNDAQWLWCYMNEMEDRKDDERMWKTRLDYMGWYVDPERAKSVMEEDEAREAEESNPNKKVIKEGVYSNDEFMLEAKAAELGYDPGSGMTAREFLDKHLQSQQQSQDVDIINDDFDTLLASGQFVNVTNADNSVGNSRESESDFLSRVAGMQEFADASFDAIENSSSGRDDDLIPIDNPAEVLIDDLLGGDDGENSKIYFNDKSIKNYDSRHEKENQKVIIDEGEIQSFENMSPEELKRFLEEHGLTEDDLDIIEIPDDEE